MLKNSAASLFAINACGKEALKNASQPINTTRSGNRFYVAVLTGMAQDKTDAAKPVVDSSINGLLRYLFAIAVIALEIIVRLPYIYAEMADGHW
jgi:hypothetical protein